MRSAIQKFARPAKPALVAAILLTSAVAITSHLGTPQAQANQNIQADFDRGYADLAASILPSVVNVSVERDVARQNDPLADPEMRRFFERFFGPNTPLPERRGGAQPARNEGSGFVIDSAAGLIVTNAHVVKDADKISVATQDGRRLDATLKGIDEKTDLALLELVDDTELPAVQFADSDRVRVGDKVLAVGNPFGLGGTVTSGIVSATGRELGSGPYDDFLQLDAAINRGNSGGPTFNLDGEVIGVNTLIFSPSGGNVGIGFAISANLAQSVIADLADDGLIERGWLGVSIQPLNDNLAAALGLVEPAGALVASIVADSPAAAAGLAEGDVILGFDGVEIDKPSTLSKTVASRDPESRNDVEIWRDGKRRSVSVQLGILEDRNIVVSQAPSEDTDVEGLGLTVRPASDEDRSRVGVNDRTGLVVTDIAADGSAARQDIRVNDVILSVDNQPLASAQEFGDAIAAARGAGRDAVALLIARENGQLFTALSLAAS